MHFVFKSKLAASSKYRPEIDGLRAIAILPVVFYHAGFSFFSGGFVGVDVFFVISGYLITSIIVKDIALQRFSLLEFYDRRIRRIFPALFAVVVFCIASTALLFPPQDFEQFGKSLVALAFFVSNIFFRRSANPDGYFDPAADEQPLLHTWTLSVEEQFYIFFPIGLWLINRYSKNTAKTAACLLVVLLVSFALSIYAVEYKPLGAFYLLPARAWELLLGSFLALKVLPRITNAALREGLAVCGLAFIGLAVCFYRKDIPFPGFAALPPCLGACLIIYATEAGESFTKKALSTSPMVFTGLISYSLYLWHWPIIVFAKYYFVGRLSASQTAAAVLASVLMAFLSFELVETPFRKRDAAESKWRAIHWGTLVSFACITIGVAIASSHGLPQRFDSQTRALIAANTDRKTDHGSMQACTHWRKDVKSMADLVLCPIGSMDPSVKKILFWGDSHVEQLQLPINRLYDDGALGDHTVIFALAAGCPPVEHMNLTAGNYHCDDFFRIAMQRAQLPDVDTVYLGFSTSWALDDGKLCEVKNYKCARTLSKEEAQDRFILELAQHIQELNLAGKKVVISLPFPIYDRSIPSVELHNLIIGKLGSRVIPLEIDSVSFRNRVLDVVTKSGAVVFDPRVTLCATNNCLYDVQNVSIYSDSNHIAASQAEIFKASLASIFR